MMIHNLQNIKLQNTTGHNAIDISEMFQVEIKKMRFIEQSTHLKHFMVSYERWELLCLICYLDGDSSYGIHDYIGMLKSKRCSDLTILKFLRERVSCGDFVIVSGPKKSRKTLMPSYGLMDEFRSYQEQGISWMLSVIK